MLIIINVFYNIDDKFKNINLAYINEIDYPIDKGLTDYNGYIGVYDMDLCCSTIADIVKLDITCTNISAVTYPIKINGEDNKLLKFIKIYINNIDSYKAWRRRYIIEDLL